VILELGSCEVVRAKVYAGTIAVHGYESNHVVVAIDVGRFSQLPFFA